MAEVSTKRELQSTPLLQQNKEGKDIIDPGEFKSPEELYAQLREKVLKYHPSDDMTMIKKAYDLASEAHSTQHRKSGEPYIVHPLSVAIILSDLEMDKETIAAGLLHDVVEDTTFTEEDIRREFGDEVELLVSGVTKLGKIGFHRDKVEEQAENLRKMFLAMAKDIRVIIIKLADRLHNMRTLQYMKPEKQKEIARETLDIYSPIAGRLGIAKIKNELDDRALMYLHPDVYQELVDEMDSRVAERQRFIESIVTVIRKRLDEYQLKGSVKGRVKHYFSIYKKMVNQEKTIDQIYDLYAVRIIVDTIPDCYAAIGMVHEMFKPVPGRFKDYIAMPKPNMYQSLHTTLIGPGGMPFEVQIRTEDMHRTAEYGIAAHWKYKEASNGVKDSGNNEEEKLAWLRQILEWQRDMSDNREFMSLLKSDLNLFSDNVYVFSPAGDVKALPTGSCTVDFAYSVHSAVGNRMVGARVNGKLVPIEYILRTGDQIEIVTSQNAKGPSRDWLKIVKSTQAKNKINQWFRKQLKSENIDKGREMIAAYAKNKGYAISELLKPEFLNPAMERYGFKELDNMLATIGYGGLKESQVVNRMIDAYEKEKARNITDQEVLEVISHNKEKLPLVRKEGRSGIIVKGMKDLAVHFAKCCSPIPGDEIVGYITRGRGVTIHRTDCINLIHMNDYDRARLLEAEWQMDNPELGTGSAYLAEISIYCTNRTGLLADVSKTFSERRISIVNVMTRNSVKQGTANIDISFEVHSREELDELIRILMNIPSVIDITRKTG